MRGRGEEAVECVVSLLDVAAALEQVHGRAGGDPGAERVRYVHASDLGFHGGEVVAVEHDAGGARVTLSLPGLCGAETPLPLYLADEIGRDDEHGAAIRGLLDVVHHRLITLLLAGVAGAEVAGALRPDAGDAWSGRLLGLVDPDGAGLPPPLRLRLLPLLVGPRSAEALAAALRLALAEVLPARASLRVATWAGGWAPLAEELQTRLGAPATRLGEGVLVGAEVFHPAGAAEVIVGPLRRAEACALAEGLACRIAAALCAAFSPAPVRFELVLEIEDATPGEGRLGEDLWLVTDAGAGVRARRRVALGAPGAWREG